MINRKIIKRTLAGLLAAAVLVTSQGFGSIPMGKVQAKEEQDTMVMWYQTPADINTAESSGGKWMQESLPLGNGDLGNLIFGGIERERIHFNEKSLWTGGPSDSRPNYQFGNTNTPYTAEEIEAYRRVLDDKSTNVFNDTISGYGMGTPIRFPGANMNKGSYQDFGDIWVDYSAMGVNSNTVSNYRRELNLHTGIASTSFVHQGTTYLREHFVSSPDQVMVTRLSASEKGKLDISVSMELNNTALTENISINGENRTITISGNVKDNGLKFRTTLKLLLTGGSVRLEENSFVIEDADEVSLIMAAATNYKNDFPVYRDNELNLETLINDKVDKAAAKTYRQLKDAHVADHRGLFDRVTIDLGDINTTTPTNVLVQNYRNGQYSNYLDALSFQFGRYLTIAGSRGNLPSNLVGLWTVGASAWTGDYHFNVNVQMNYWPVYVSNLAECGVTMVNYMDDLREPGRLTAERIHGIENATTEHTGFTVHTENNPFGMTAPTNAQEYGWNPTGAAWAVQNIWAHYEFTQDVEYLKNKIYPIMKEAALFWDNYLWTSEYQRINDESSPYHGEGRLVVAPSFSEEQGPTAVGTTYDQSLVWELYKECVAAGKIVGESEELIKHWEESMKRLDPIEINATNGIKEWYEETRVGLVNGQNKSFAQAGNLAEIQVPNSGWNIGHPGEHRHASHLVGLYPGTLINRETPEYMEAAIVSLTERGEYSTGWSKANKINLWARTGNGEKAYRLLNNLIGGNTSGLQYNLFDSHGSGGGETMKNGSPVWQIDGNFGLTSGVAEMLLQSHMGYVEFLPAIPAAWSEGEVNGLKARGNFTIGQKWSNSVPEYFTVSYDGPKSVVDFTGTYPDIENARVTEKGREVEVEIKDGKLSFRAQKGKVYTIHMEETNNDILVAKAQEYLDRIPEALSKVKEQLQEEITGNSSLLSQTLEKAKLMVGMYENYLAEAENIYYMTTTEGLSLQEIDSMYVTLRDIYGFLLENSMSLEEMKQQETVLNSMITTLQKQMESRVISFSKESGTITRDGEIVALTGGGGLYKIFYTTDGSTPDTKATEYTGAISLDINQNTTIKAALFSGKQRVSPVYQKEYSANFKFDTAETETDNHGAQYVPGKMIDNDITSRWASKDGTGDIEILFTFNEEREINTIKFNQFVSQRNSTDGFEIWAEKNGVMEKLTEGTKLGAGSDDVGGNRAYKTISFDKVTTAKVKVVLKEGYQEPSFYEMQPMLIGVEQEEIVDTTVISALIQEGNALNREGDSYLQAEETLRNAFEAILKEAAASVDKTQAEINNREVFLRKRLLRLGVGEEDKELLSQIIMSAEAIEKETLTRNSKYILEKALLLAKEVKDNPEADQSEIDGMAGQLQKVIAELEYVMEREVDVNASSYEGNDWITAGEYRATNSDATLPLTYSFMGSNVKVTTVKANDHGILAVTITDSENNVVYEELLDTYATERAEGVVLLEESLPLNQYVISFVRRGVSSNTTGQGWVEVGPMTIRQPHVEVVDRSSLEREIGKAEGINSEIYTAETYEKLMQQLEEARQLLSLPEGETCTAQMEEEAGKLAAAREGLQRLISVDFTLLKATLEEAKAYSEEDYTEKSYQALAATIREIESFMEGPCEQYQVEEKHGLLKQRISELRTIEVGDPVEYPENLWLSGIRGDLSYTGSKVVQNFEIYDGDKKLTEKVDYTVTYKNNVNASQWNTEGDGVYVECLEKGTMPLSVLETEEMDVKVLSKEPTDIEEVLIDEDLPSNLKKSPQVTVKMKGNYKGTYTIYYEIQKVSIAEAKADNLSVTYISDTKNQTPAPTVTYQGKKLVMNKDFEVKEYLEDKNQNKKSFTGEAGKTVEKTLTLRGIGNYSGEKTIQLVIGKKGGEDQVEQISLSKVTVKNVKPVTWDKEKVKAGGMKQDFSVTYKKDILLEEQEEFAVSYENNDKVGTASLILTGNGEDKDGDGYAYIGVKRINFKINGNSMSKVKVENLDQPGYTFTGEEIRPLETDRDVKITLNKVEIPQEAYTVEYQKNISAGTATILLKGIEKEGYTGVKKQTFKIVAETLDKTDSYKNTGFTVAIVDPAAKKGQKEEVQMPYTKGGVTPKIKVTNPWNEELKEGTDYTVTYKNHTKLGAYSDGKKAPTIVVKGKGNFAGTVEKTFTIIPKDLTDTQNKDDVTVVATDKVVSSKKNGWKSSFKVLDQSGKALTKKEAQLSNALYTIEKLPQKSDGIDNYDQLVQLGTTTPIPDTMKIPAGTTIKITVNMAEGSGTQPALYQGTVSGTYRILEEGKDISKYTFKLKNQDYTGKEIYIDETTDFASIKYKKQEIPLSLEKGDNQSLEVVPGSYVKNINKGTAKVTLRGVGEYGGTKTVSFKIQQKDGRSNLIGIFSLIFGN